MQNDVAHGLPFGPPLTEDLDPRKGARSMAPTIIYSFLKNIEN